MKNFRTNTRVRLRDIIKDFGILPTGTKNAISDVPGVSVGHCSLIHGNGTLVPSKGPIRTGITIIKPHKGNIYRQKVRASSYVLNGYGKTIGLVQLEELGYIESYIALTNTLNVPLVADALLDYHLTENPDIGITTSSINVVVAECNDSFLNDIQGRHVKKEHVFEAITSGSENIEEGNIGAGTGMRAFGYKAGIGTSSRKIVQDKLEYIIGILVLSNFGSQRDLIVLGKNFHNQHDKIKEERKDHGSIIIILATNAPLTSRQLKRLAKRATMGLARTGSFASHGSGDIIIAFTTENIIEHDDKKPINNIAIINESTKLFNDLLLGVVEATEEAILNSLLKAETMIGRNDHRVEAVSINKIKELLGKK